MKKVRLLLVKTVGLACIASAASSQTTISERVRLAKETPGTPVVMGVLGEPVRMTVEELTKRSAVVLDARLSWRTTYINAADTAVVTDLPSCRFTSSLVAFLRPTAPRLDFRLLLSWRPTEARS